MIYNAETLIAEIRTIGGLPSNEVPGYTKAELLKHASAVIRSRLLPLILRSKEGYFLQRQRVTITAGQNYYPIPSRAVGDTLRAIWYVDGAGSEKEIDPIPIPDLHNYSPTSSTLHGFYLTSNHIVLVGNPGSGYLEILFPFRVGDLILQTEARQITAVDPATKLLTFATAIPATWVVGTKLDIHSQLGGQDMRMWAEPIATLPEDTPPPPPPPQASLTLTHAIDGSVTGTFSLAVGDWVCPERQSALVALPEELIPALARGVAMRIAEMEKDGDAADYHQQQMVEDVGAVTPLLADRSTSKPKHIRGSHSPYCY